MSKARNPYALNISKYSTHNMIARAISKNKTVLDVGCNDGYLGKISHSSNVFYGLDHLDDSVLKAKEVYKDALVFDLNHTEKLPWGKKFDVVVFADVLEHVLYPEKVLRFFVDEYLKDGGRVIISLPNVANWQVRLQLFFGKFEYQETGILDKTHLHLYTFRTAAQLAENCGLVVKKGIGGASFFGPILSLLPCLRSLLATNIILVNEKK